MSNKKQQDRNKLFVRVICIVLAVALIASSLLAALGNFG